MIRRRFFSEARARRRERFLIVGGGFNMLE